MLRKVGPGVCRRPTLLFWCLYVFVEEHTVYGHNRTVETREMERPFCEQGYYCPVGSPTPVPCPKGTFGPTVGARSIDSCLSCPTNHYCPRPALTSGIPCGAWAQQPLPGQDRCVCLGEGQTFQASDGHCPCALGYRLMGQGDTCLHSVYDICRDGRARTQHGTCLDRQQWAQHCTQQVCLSPGDYQGFDGALGLCLCREPPERAVCGGWCRSRPKLALHLVCAAVDLQLVYSNSEGQVSVSGSVLLETVFKRWDSQGTLQCDGRHNVSLPVYTVQTNDAGFLGLLNDVPAEIRELFPEKSMGMHSSTGDSGVREEGGAGSDWSSRATTWGGTMNSSSVGILNPTACLHLRDTLLFTVTRQHYPQYDVENLYNTNRDFDWGPLRRLAEDLTLARTPPTLFSLVFTQPGVYAFKLSDHQYKHMYVRVMPAGGQCYEAGPFFPTVPYHVIRMGIAKRRHLLLRPDWLVTGGLLLGAVVILSLCVTLLILFREYGWPEKVATRAQYRTLQLQYPMEDYASKGSRVTTLKKYHRNLQARMTDASIQPALHLEADEFWDYEHQVDLEAFSTNTFYSILLKHSVSVTARLSQLRGEVKDLYQGVMDKLKGLQLQPGWSAVGKTREGYERLRRQVEQEVIRRRSLAQQLRHLLDSQLGVLRTELMAQQTVHRTFGAHLRECVRLLGQAVDNTDHPLWDEHPQHVVQRVASLASEMAEQVSGECQRQGAWATLGEGTGAKLLCPDTGSVLSKEDIIAPDGSVRACGAVQTDSVTGLILPKPHTHMLLASGHSMPVPPDFFLHPQTGRLLPVAGNVGYDPASSILVFTTDSCTGDMRKWEFPLLPFVPYPLSRHSAQPVTTQLRGLRPGQRLLLGRPMCDPDTGVLVPILAVTIHPQTGLVYPLGGVHVCPLTRLPQPIQVGSPMLDPMTGNVVLIAGVSLDPITGAVLPVGGLLLGESFIEPLSSMVVRVGGGSIRAGKLVPHAGGFQTLLNSQTLVARIRLVELLRGLREDWGSGEMGLLGLQAQRKESELGRIQAAAKELEQAWGKGLHCHLQLLSRLETLLDWAWGVVQDGGVQGEIHLPGADLSLPALPGMEYPDPQGSGLTVPILGAQMDPVSGLAVPLAGTMEDPDGKGLVAIRFGALTVDPVTGVLAPVVGVRLDVSRQTVVPVTASYCLALGDNTDSVLVEALQKEWCLRNRYWKEEKQKEEELLGDLDAALQHCVLVATQEDSEQANWVDNERQLREAAAELHEAGQSEAQRRASQLSDLSLLLPPHVLLILTQGDDKEWEQQCCWQTELVAGLDRVNVCVEKLQQDQERWTAQRGEQTPSIHVMDGKLRQREIWEQLNSRQAELDAALIALRCVRELCQLRADTAQSVLSGSFWYKEFGLARLMVPSNPLKVVSLTQQKAVPLMERLIQLLEENKEPSLSPSTYRQRISGLSTKQTFGLETCSRAWTESVPVVKVRDIYEGISTQSLRDPMKEQPQDQDSKGLSVPQPSPPHSQTAHRKAAISDMHSQEGEPMKESVQQSHVCVPTLSEGEWDKLLELSPLFQLLKRVERKLRGPAQDAGFLRGELDGRASSFIDYLDAQWECEGELLLLDPGRLNPREFLVYHHGLFLLQTLHTLELTPAVSLQIATSLPSNNYKYNAFRNSFFYQLLQACLGELFEARLGSSSMGMECAAPESSMPWDSHPTSLLEGLQRPSRGLLSQEEVEGLLQKHREDLVFLHVERLLRKKSLGLRTMEVRHKAQEENTDQAQ